MELDQNKNRVVVTRRKSGDRIVLETKDGIINLIVSKTSNNHVILVAYIPNSVTLKMEKNYGSR